LLGIPSIQETEMKNIPVSSRGEKRNGFSVIFEVGTVDFWTVTGMRGMPGYAGVIVLPPQETPSNFTKPDILLDRFESLQFTVNFCMLWRKSHRKPTELVRDKYSCRTDDSPSLPLRLSNTMHCFRLRFRRCIASTHCRLPRSTRNNLSNP